MPAGGMEGTWDAAAPTFKRLMTAPGTLGAVIREREAGRLARNAACAIGERGDQAVIGVPTEGIDRVGQKRKDNCTSTRL